MSKRRGRRPKPIPLTIGNDPELWRFNSRHEALEANTALIAQLILASAEIDQPNEAEIDLSGVTQASPASAAAG